MKYPLFKVYINKKQALKEIEKVFDSGFLNEGTEVTKLTSYFNTYLNTSRVVALNSCTSALTLALKLANVLPGDEVITVSMTCVATNTPILNVGGKVVWADINYHTGNINAFNVEKLISSKTKAIICVNWAGLPCDLDMLSAICKKHNIKLIQDAAHSFGATYNGEHIWHSADYTCYSLQAIKHITTGDGGLLVVNTNDADFERAKRLKWFGIDRDSSKDEKGEWKGQRWQVDIPEAGYKFHMNNITAAIGLAQFDSILNITNSHKENGLAYAKAFKGTKVVSLEYPSNATPAFWVYTVLLPDTIDRDDTIKRLNSLGIDAGLVHVPNHTYTCFKDSLVELPDTDYFNKHQISLPCGWWLTKEDITYISHELLNLVS